MHYTDLDVADTAMMMKQQSRAALVALIKTTTDSI